MYMHNLCNDRLHLINYIIMLLYATFTTQYATPDQRLPIIIQLSKYTLMKLKYIASSNKTVKQNTYMCVGIYM